MLFKKNSAAKREDAAKSAQEAEKRLKEEVKTPYFRVQLSGINAIFQVSECLPVLSKAAEIGLNASAFEPPEQIAVKEITPEQAAEMSDERLKSAREQSRAALSDHWHNMAREAKACISNLEAARGWDVADEIARDMRELVAACEARQDTARANESVISAEQAKREAAAEKERREREYFAENYVDIIRNQSKQIEELKAQVEAQKQS